jgi:hypothetical protein
VLSYALPQKRRRLAGLRSAPRGFGGRRHAVTFSPAQTHTRLIRRNPAEAEANPLPRHEAQAEADVRRPEGRARVSCSPS